MTPIFMFYDNTILLYTFERFRLNLNARSLLLSKSCKECASLTPAVDKEKLFPKFIKLRFALFSVPDINVYTHRHDNYMLRFFYFFLLI